MKTSRSTFAFLRAVSGSPHTEAAAKKARPPSRFDTRADATADPFDDEMVALAEMPHLYADLSAADFVAAFDPVDLDGDGFLSDDEIALARAPGLYPKRR